MSEKIHYNSYVHVLHIVPGQASHFHDFMHDFISFFNLFNVSNVLNLPESRSIFEVPCRK